MSDETVKIQKSMPIADNIFGMRDTIDSLTMKEIRPSPSENLLLIPGGIQETENKLEGNGSIFALSAANELYSKVQNRNDLFKYYRSKEIEDVLDLSDDEMKIVEK